MTEKIDPEFMKNYDEFIRQINIRHVGETIKPSGDEVSVFDMVQALSKKFGEYNNKFFGNYNKKLYSLIDLFNRRNGYNALNLFDLDRKCRRIGNIGFYVEEDGYYYCKLEYCDQRGRKIGEGIIDNTVKVDACDDEAVKNKKELMHFLSILADFASKNPNMSFRWDLLNPQVETFTVGDDMLSFAINIYSLEGIQPYFRNAYNVSNYADFDHNYANELISQCSKDFMKRISVNLNDIDPLLADIVRKEYNLEAQKLVK